MKIIDGNDKDMWKEDCHFCPKCACPLDWEEGEKK